MPLIHVMCVPSIDHSKKVTWKGRGREEERGRKGEMGGRERGLAIVMQAIDTKRDVACTFLMCAWFSLIFALSVHTVISSCECTCIHVFVCTYIMWYLHVQYMYM